MSKSLDPRDTFIAANLAFGASVERHASKAANRAANLAKKSAVKIHSEPDRGRSFFLTLAEDESDWVRLAAFSYLLLQSDPIAIDGLRALTQHSTPELSLYAESSLREWEKGTLAKGLLDEQA